MGLCRLTIVTFALALQLLLVTNAARIQFRSDSFPDDSLIPSDWKNVFSMLVSVVEDDDFQESIREYIRNTEGGGRPNYCRLTAVVCDASSAQVTGLNVSYVSGRLSFTAIPKTVTTVVASHCMLKQSADLTTLPYWVKRVALSNVSFSSSNSKRTLRLLKKHSMLQELECIRCGLFDVEWSSLPSLTHIDLSLNDGIAPIDLSVLPPTLRLLNLSGCSAEMEAAALVSLPPSLQSLDLSSNKLRGSISSVVFPSALDHVFLQNNLLEGELLMDNFPFSIVEFDLSGNKLSGTFGDLSHFMTLRSLQARSNKITHLFWEKLPMMLEHIDVSENLLTGTLNVMHLPATLVYFNVSRNVLTGPLSMERLPSQLATFDVSYNRFSGNVDLTKFSEAMRFVHIERNLLTGTPDLTSLPVNLRRILIFDNRWDSMMPPLYD